MTDADVVDRQLALARQGFTPTGELRERVRARLGQIGHGTGVVAQGVAGRSITQEPSRWRSLRASGKVGLGVGVGLFGLGVAVGASVAVGWVAPALLRAPAADVSLQSYALPAALIEVPAAPEETTQAESVQRKRSPSATLSERDAAPEGSAKPRPPRAAPPRTAAGRDWRAELELLERAERSVRADNAALALSLLADFDAGYPHSKLIEERRAIEVMAHCQARATDGTARAERFLRAHPSSVYAERIKEACRLGAVAPRPSPL